MIRRSRQCDPRAPLRALPGIGVGGVPEEIDPALAVAERLADVALGLLQRLAERDGSLLLIHLRQQHAKQILVPVRFFAEPIVGQG